MKIGAAKCQAKVKTRMYLVRVASLAVAAIFGTCALITAFDPATAGPIAISNDGGKTAPNAGPVSPGTPGARKSRTKYAVSGSAPAPTATTQQTVPEPGRAYLFRGALGLIFSRGMDKLTKRIEQAGITATVNEFTLCGLVAKKAIRDYRQKPAPISIIGHSMGGFCALEFAAMLQAENIPVNLVVTIDPAHLMPKLPSNVERYINIFLAHDVLGGGDVTPEKDYQGHYASFDLSKHKGVLHINIDKMDVIHTQLVTKIEQLPATPAKTEGGAVPIRYVVPADAAIELWDSGTPAFVRPGDTLETLAAFYRVPLWSLTQINQVAPSTPLMADQPIIVPRFLVPLDAVSGQAPLKR
jgi:hypothetical protein